MFGIFKQFTPGKNKSSDNMKPHNSLDSSDDDLTVVKSNSQTNFRSTSCQSTGRIRTHNEDTLFTFYSLLDGVDSPLSLGIFMIADGMGGHQSGEVASRLAVKGASQYLIDKIYGDYFYKGKSFSDRNLKQLLKESVEEAQAMIQQQVPGGGTTLTFVLALGDRLFSAHVGDSRLYLLDLAGKMKIRTKDHTLVKRLIDLGEISEKEATSHPNKNVLYRALGQEEPFEPDIDQFAMKKGERLLLCSDGLWGVVDEKQMLDIINNSANMDEMVCKLVDAANDAGGPDNISVVMVEKLT